MMKKKVYCKFQELDNKYLVINIRKYQLNLRLDSEKSILILYGSVGKLPLPNFNLATVNK